MTTDPTATASTIRARHISSLKDQAAKGDKAAEAELTRLARSEWHAIYGYDGSVARARRRAAITAAKRWA